MISSIFSSRNSSYDLKTYDSVDVGITWIIIPKPTLPDHKMYSLANKP